MYVCDTLNTRRHSPERQICAAAAELECDEAGEHTAAHRQTEQASTELAELNAQLKAVRALQQRKCHEATTVDTIAITSDTDEHFVCTDAAAIRSTSAHCTYADAKAASDDKNHRFVNIEEEVPDNMFRLTIQYVGIIRVRPAALGEGCAEQIRSARVRMPK